MGARCTNASNDGSRNELNVAFAFVNKHSSSSEKDEDILIDIDTDSNEIHINGGFSDDSLLKMCKQLKWINDYLLYKDSNIDYYYGINELYATEKFQNWLKIIKIDGLQIPLKIELISFMFRKCKSYHHNLNIMQNFREFLVSCIDKIYLKQISIEIEKCYQFSPEYVFDDDYNAMTNVLDDILICISTQCHNVEKCTFKLDDVPADCYHFPFTNEIHQYFSKLTYLDLPICARSIDVKQYYDNFQSFLKLRSSQLTHIALRFKSYMDTNTCSQFIELLALCDKLDVIDIDTGDVETVRLSQIETNITTLLRKHQHLKRFSLRCYIMEDEAICNIFNFIDRYCVKLLNNIQSLEIIGNESDRENMNTTASVNIFSSKILPKLKCLSHLTLSYFHSLNGKSFSNLLKSICDNKIPLNKLLLSEVYESTTIYQDLGKLLFDRHIETLSSINSLGLSFNTNKNLTNKQKHAKKFVHSLLNIKRSINTYYCSVEHVVKMFLMDNGEMTQIILQYLVYDEPVDFQFFGCNDSFAEKVRMLFHQEINQNKSQKRFDYNVNMIFHFWGHLLSDDYIYSSIAL